MTNKTAFIFPGQNSQEVGMGRAWAAAYPAAERIFADADDILGRSLSTLCWTGPAEDLNQTENTQPAIFTTTLAILAALRSDGFTLQADFVAGHSLGEYAAYVTAGVISFADGLRLVQERGRLMKKAGDLNPGKMAVILQLDDEVVAGLCAQASEEAAAVQVTNYNSPGQVVISGYEAGVDRAIELAKAAGARRANKLDISIAAHSSLMAVVSDEFEAAVKQVSISAPAMPIIANNSAQPLTEPAAIRREMVEQLTSPLYWTNSIRYMIEQGVIRFIEIGPKEVLAGLNKRIDRGVPTITVTKPDDLQQLKEATQS
jgi:[acyl-carrier-protein] S-malonyltransferase